MRLTHFWERMDEHFGPAYARSWAADVVLAELGGRTVMQALDQGEETRTVWLAVWEHEAMPASAR